MIRVDKDLQAVKILSRATEKSVVVLPIGAASTNAGLPNENLSQRNMFESIKVMAAYLFQISFIKHTQPEV